MPLSRPGVVLAPGPLQGQTVFLAGVRLPRRPVGVVDCSAVLPGPCGASLPQLDPAHPHVSGVAAGHQRLHELMVVQVNRGQSSPAVDGRTDSGGFEPGGGDGRHQVAAAVVATPAGRTLVCA